MSEPAVTQTAQPCKYGDPTCPCQDGDQCHYEGADGWLLPCPFCGCHAKMQESDDGANFIECTNSACASTTNLQYSEKDDGRPWLVQRWNTRIAEPLRQQLAQANAENAELKQKGSASHACYCGELPSGKKCMACQLQTAERSLEELREKMRWIPVSEKAPAIGSYVLVWKPERWEEPFEPVTYSQDSETHRLYTRRDGQWWDRGAQITHWRAIDPPTEAERLLEEG